MRKSEVEVNTVKYSQIIAKKHVFNEIERDKKQNQYFFDH